ncbi:hypothetical protein ACH79_04920 [Bradyrhizobium sp. CCBAU 051011]|nr:hypothetical protein ACH79_04920 [Bradyrhizobium sp. CCBAU 051011]
MEFWLQAESEISESNRE